MKAFQELAKGEQTATQLENNLDRLEARIEALLASADENKSMVDSAHEEEGENTNAEQTSSNTTESQEKR